MTAVASSAPVPPASPGVDRRGRLRQRLAELSLLQRLLLVEALLIFFAFLGVLGLVRWYADSLTSRIDSERYLLARAFGDEVEHLLRHGFEELNASALELRSERDAAPVLDRLVSEEIFASGALVLDDRDRVVAADSRRQSLRGGQLTRETELTVGRTDGRAAWGMHLADGTAHVVFTVPAGGLPPGYRVAGIVPVADGEIASVFTRAVAIAATGHAELVDEHGAAMFTTEAGHGLKSSDHPSLHRQIVTGVLAPGTHRASHEEEGEEEEASADTHVMAVTRLDVLPWVFALGGTEADTYAPVNTLWRAFFSLTAVAGALAVGVTLVGAPRLTEPVRQLSEAARRVARGGLETPIAIGSGGEIGELGRSVETMRRSLYDWGVTLDQRVMERTKEIEERSLELAASAEVARIAGSTFDVDTMLQVATDYIESVFDADGVVAYLPSRGRRNAVQVFSHRLRQGRPAGAPEDCAACLSDGGGGSVVLHAGDERLPPCLRAANDTRGPVPGDVVAIRSPIPGDDGAYGALCLLFRADPTRHRPGVATLQLLASTLSFGVRNADLYQDVRQREVQARHLVGKVLTAQEEERRRVARELHDDAGQALAGIMFGLDALERLGPDRAEARLQQAAGLRVIVKETIENLRRTIFALRPPALDDLGLEAAILRYADLHAKPAGISVSISGSVDSHGLGADGEVALFRVIQEALNNVVRHSGATAVQIRLRQHADNAIEVLVRDDGRGFDVDAAWRADAVGIYGMAERAEILGGTLEVRSEPGQGTSVRAVFPAAADLPAPAVQ